MKDIRQLWQNKRDSQGRIDITIFFLNVFLLMTHIFLMVLYLIVGHKFMVIINIVSLLFYSVWFLSCYKKKEVYIGFTFLEIWLHMLCGMCSFGWHAAYQNWTFALLVGTFLPSFKTEGTKTNYKASLAYATIVIISYLLFSVLIHVIPMTIYTEVDGWLLRTLFTFNNMIVFIAIILLSIFYTIRNESRVHELTRKADFDELTEMYNRHSFNYLAKGIIYNSIVSKGYYCVAIFDLDHFKKINDTYGHQTGDIVLKGVAEIIIDFSTKRIKSGRWGGEEFVMIAPSSVEYAAFCNRLEKIRKKVESTKFKSEDGRRIKVTISIGAARLNDDLTVDEAISNADKNLYVAKKTGRNKLVK